MGSNEKYVRKDSSIKRNKEELNNIEAVKTDNYNNYFSNWRMNPEYAFYKKRLFNSPQLWNSNFFMSKETMCVLRSLIDVWLPDFKFGPGKCALTIIGLSLLPAVFVHAKEEVGNDITVYNKGLALDKLGNDTGAILYYDKATSLL